MRRLRSIFLYVFLAKILVAQKTWLSYQERCIVRAYRKKMFSCLVFCLCDHCSSHFGGGNKSKLAKEFSGCWAQEFFLFDDIVGVLGLFGVHGGT